MGQIPLLFWVVRRLPPVVVTRDPLRLGGRDLNRRRRMIEAGRTPEVSGGERSFVEIDPVHGS